MSDTANHAEYSRLRWRCRRGMRELDVMLSGWLADQFEQATPALQSSFVALLECEDDQIWDWMTGRADPTTHELASIVQVLRKDDLRNN